MILHFYYPHKQCDQIGQNPKIDQKQEKQKRKYLITFNNFLLNIIKIITFPLCG